LLALLLAEAVADPSLASDVRKLLGAVQRVNSDHAILEDKLNLIDQSNAQAKDQGQLQDERIRLQEAEIILLKTANIKLLERLGSIETVMTQVADGERFKELELRNRELEHQNNLFLKRLEALEAAHKNEL
jgi:hypothetical protein